MASAERLLNEAHDAFASISFGESRANRRHTARAKSLCRKIILRYPESTEAAEARAILRRLGEDAYVSILPDLHWHKTQSEHHRGSGDAIVRSHNATSGQSPTLDWSSLIAVIMMTPKIVLGVLGAVIVALFALFGPFIFLALLALVVLTGPFRSILTPAQRAQVEEFVVRANEFIDERRRNGTGLA